MEFTKEEMEMIAGHLPTIEKIIVNNSCSNLSISFRQDMRLLADKLKLPYCTSCASGIFNIVGRVYKIYTQQVNNNKKETNNKNGRSKGKSRA